MLVPRQMAMDHTNKMEQTFFSSDLHHLLQTLRHKIFFFILKTKIKTLLSLSGTITPFLLI